MDKPIARLFAYVVISFLNLTGDNENQIHVSQWNIASIIENCPKTAKEVQNNPTSTLIPFRILYILVALAGELSYALMRPVLGCSGDRLWDATELVRMASTSHKIFQKMLTQ